MSSHKFPEIHGHRGARGLFPENSLPAICAATSMGCDAVEIDVCVTRDNQLVVLHDLLLSDRFVRDSSGKWLDNPIAIRSLNAADIHQFDIGRINPCCEYALQFPDQEARDHTRIPLLDDYVDTLLESGRHVRFNIELKGAPYDPELVPQPEEYVDLVIEFLERRNIVQRTFLQSFDWRLPLAIKQSLPGLACGLISDLQPDGDPMGPLPGQPSRWQCDEDIEDFTDLPHMVKALGGDVWSSNFLDLSSELVDSAHEAGLEIYTWTVNNERDMEQAVAMGVDAITTDYPDRLVELRNSQDS